MYPLVDAFPIWVEIIAAMEPTVGGINLEDIRAPECYYIEKELRQRMNIPVFHDDQHGTAIIAGAAIINALQITGKKLEEATLVCSGAGAAAIACLKLMVNMGMPKENITVVDSRGVIWECIVPYIEPNKDEVASDTVHRTIE